MNRIVTDLPAEAYFKAEGLSGSLLVEGARSMKRAKWYVDNPKEETPAMRWGNLQHPALLEPDRFESELVVFEGKSKRGSAWTEFVAENQGKYCVTEEESELLAAAMDSIRSRPDAMALLTEGDREASAFWETTVYGKAKGRMDVYDVNHIVDLKTTGDLDNFKNVAARMLYHVKMGWYQIGAREITGKLLPVYIVAVEQDPPFDVRVFEYDSEALAIGRDIAINTAKKYRACQQSGVYPGACEDVQTLRLPEWMIKQHMEKIDVESIEPMEAKDL